MIAMRCGLCAACLRVADVQRLIIPDFLPPLNYGVSDYTKDASVHLWNDTLKENPCAALTVST